MTDATQASNDSADLEALFDSVAATVGVTVDTVASPGHQPGGRLSLRIGQMTRALHQKLHQINLDSTADVGADASGGADGSIDIDAAGAALKMRWRQLFKNQLSVEEFKQLAQQTHDYLGTLPQQTMSVVDASKAQDLTRQSIVLLQSVETELLGLLLDTLSVKEHQQVEVLAREAIASAAGGGGGVIGPQQADKLLGGLGF